MIRLRRIIRLTMGECILLGAAMMAVVPIRLGLYLLPFRILRSTLALLTRPNANPSQRVKPQQVAWAVRTVSRYVPRATCLTQALAMQAILAILGISATLRIGVAPSQKNRLEAHAWLEYEDQIVIGWETRGRFIPFPPIEVGKS